MSYFWSYNIDVEEELRHIKSERQREFQSEQAKLRQPRPIGCECTLRYTCGICLGGKTA